MGRDFTATINALLLTLMCPSADAFVVPSSTSSGRRVGTDVPWHHKPDVAKLARERPLLPTFCRSGKRRRGECNSAASNQLPPPKARREEPASLYFRIIRGGMPGVTTIESSKSSSSSSSSSRLKMDAQKQDEQMKHDEPEMFEISIVNHAEHEGAGLESRQQTLEVPQDLGDLLFLARSSQPASIGDRLQKRGVRVFPQEAFVDAGYSRSRESGACDVDEGGNGNAGGLEKFRWEAGTPLPWSTAMVDLPRDELGRVRVALWDPCGPEHPLMRAMSAEPPEEASVEVVNFPAARGGNGETEDNDHDVNRGAATGSEAFQNGFDELRSAVIFREWFSVEQQQAIADAVASQIFDEEDGDEESGLSTDRTHFPLVQDRAALAAIGDGMLAALSSERFSGFVGGRKSPVPTEANREFTAVCYGDDAKMDKHTDSWKEWTLIVSIGNTIPFELGSSQGPADVRLELASGEGLLFNGHELYHAVRGVKRKTAPSFWDNHQLCVKGGFARVGVLSMKSFSSSGVVAPRWGPKGGDNCDEKDGG